MGVQNPANLVENDGAEATDASLEDILNIMDPQKRRDAIRTYVKQRAASKEEEASLMGSVLKKIQDLRAMTARKSVNSTPEPPRYDSKMDLADVGVVKQMETQLKKPKIDFFQSAEKVTVVFYIKGLVSSKCHLIYEGCQIVYFHVPGLVSKISLRGEIDPGCTRIQVCPSNVEVVFSKVVESIGLWALPPVLVSTVEGPDDIDGFITEPEINKDVPKSGLKPHYSHELEPIVSHSLNIFSHSCGMVNRGLDCYINNVVQCLLSFPEFVGRFLDQSFLSNINLDNPLSISKGQMAIAFAKLASRLLTESNPVYPFEIKRLVASYWALYDPYQQHDTQELLNFLLDCIHEDLNRAPRTPFTTENEEDLPDEALAKAYWKAHTVRNDSFIVDLFFGMYKSRIVCNNCSQASTKFDPFMSLTLEIPPQPIYHAFIIVRADLTKVEVRIAVSAKDVIKDILMRISERIKSGYMPLIATIFDSSRIHDFIDENTNLVECLPYLKSMVIFEVPPRMSYVTVAHVFRDEAGFVPFGVPFIAFVPPTESLSIGRLKLFVLDTLERASIIKTGSGSDPVHIHARVDNETDPSVHFLLKENSITNMELVWDTVEEKTNFYDEEQDNQIASFDSSETEEQCTLYDCLEKHFQSEKLDEWKCSNCKESTTASKKLDIWKPPSILILHLKRFVEHPRYQAWTKLNTRVYYPVDNLDLTKFVSSGSESCLYELVAVSNHMGSTDRGHYTAFAKRGDKWYHFDDESVLEVSDLGQLVVEHGYVLFYRRKDVIEA